MSRQHDFLFSRSSYRKNVWFYFSFGVHVSDVVLARVEKETKKEWGPAVPSQLGCSTWRRMDHLLGCSNPPASSPAVAAPPVRSRRPRRDPNFRWSRRFVEALSGNQTRVRKMRAQAAPLALHNNVERRKRQIRWRHYSGSAERQIYPSS